MTPKQVTGKVSTHLVETLFGQKAFLIHPKVVTDLLALKEAASSAGFNMNIASGFRDFDRQMCIWNRKMSGDAPILDQNSQPLDASLLSEQEKVMAILCWSALPGGSRHHWGTDFDLFDRNSLPEGITLQLEPWEYLSGHQLSFYTWLKDHLLDFGFFFPYQGNNDGVAFEPWHISHKKAADHCLTELTLDNLRHEIESSDLLGKEVVLAELETIYNRFITNIPK